MHIDPLLPALVTICLAILTIGLALRAMGQPHVVGYLVAGVAIGPSGMALVSDHQLISHMGSIGVVLLLFFIGMEVSPRRLIENWKLVIFGTLLQIAISVGCVWVIGAFLDWPIQRVVLLGFVVSLSSTAVVLKLLQDWNQMDTRIGQTVIGITLAQDLAIVPMLIVLAILSGKETSAGELSLQIVGGVLFLIVAVWIVKREQIRLPLGELLRRDHEMQVFGAALIAMGLAFLTGVFHLSTALGAFLGGILIGAAKETTWVHRSLDPFRIVFVAVFFVSVGMLIDVAFVQQHWWKVLLLVATVLLTNTFINTLAIRLFRIGWRDSLYAGALLAEIGEFSFVLASVGLQTGIINEFGYQMTIAVIALSLLFSPAWIAGMKKAIGWQDPQSVG